MTALSKAPFQQSAAGCLMYCRIAVRFLVFGTVQMNNQVEAAVYVPRRVRRLLRIIIAPLVFGPYTSIQESNPGANAQTYLLLNSQQADIYAGLGSIDYPITASIDCDDPQGPTFRVFSGDHVDQACAKYNGYFSDYFEWHDTTWY